MGALRAMMLDVGCWIITGSTLGVEPRVTTLCVVSKVFHELKTKLFFESTDYTDFHGERQILVYINPCKSV